MENAKYHMPYTVGPDKPLKDMSSRELESEAYDAQTSVLAAEENEAAGWGYDPAPRERLAAAEREQLIREIESSVRQWLMAPEDGGQIIQVEYGESEDGEMVYRRTTDRSVPQTEYAQAEYPDDLEFEPWNGAGNLRQLDWEEV